LSSGQVLSGYRIQRPLQAGRSFLADAGAQRLVVLKMLEADCLLGPHLHPAVRDRLARVRELPHVGLADLLGVQRDGEFTFMVWEYVDGLPLAEWSGAPAELPRLARELILGLRGLHTRGLVHGALHAHNVILTPAGRLRLTHVSPYLYHEISDDAGPLLALLRDLCAQSGPGADAFSHLLDRAAADKQPIAFLSTHLAELMEAQPPQSPLAPARARFARARSLILAAAVALAAAGIYHVLRQWTR
jgi:hypothetical protein